MGDETVVPLARGRSRLRYARVPYAAIGAVRRFETLRVLAVLCLYTDPAGNCFPSRRRIAREARVAQRNLGRNFRDLQEAGLLRVNPDGTYTVLGGHSPVLEEHSPVLEEHSPVLEEHSPVLPPYIEELPNEQPNRTTHSTARGCVREPQHAVDGVEVLSAAEALASDQFEALWHAYPSRPDDPKQPARAAFDEVVATGIDPEILIAAAERYAEWVTLDSAGAAYAPHLHKWLREGRYEHQTKDWPQPRRPGSNVASAVAAFAMGPLKPSSPEWGNNDNANAEPAVSDRPVSEPWIDRLKHLKDGNKWQAEWGPCWGKPGCRVPGLDTAIGQSYAIWFLRHPEQMKV